jgi:hypothetical protein
VFRVDPEREGSLIACGIAGKLNAVSIFFLQHGREGEIAVAVDGVEEGERALVLAVLSLGALG